MSTIDNAQPMLPAAQLPPMPPATTAPPEAGAAEGGTGIGAADVWRIIKQRKLLIAITFFVLYAIVVAGTFLIYRYAPTYTGQALLKFNPPTKDWIGIQPGMASRPWIEQQLQNEVNQIKVLTVLLDLLAQPEIKATQFYQWYGDDFDKCLFDLKKMLVVQPLRDSSLIRVALAVRDRKEATLIVNTLVQRYVDAAGDQDAEMRLKKINTLKNTQAEVEQQVEDVRRRIADLRSQRDMPALESERDVLVETITVLSNTRAELQIRQADLDAQLENVRGTDPRNLPLSAEMRLIIESDPVLRMYRQQVEALDVEIRVARENLAGDDHRYMKLMRSRQAELFRKEAARREELTGSLRDRQVESLRLERARLRNMLAQVQERLSEKENAQRDLDAAIQLFEGFMTDEERLNRELEKVTMAAREATHQHAVQQRERRVEIADRARDARSPTRPNWVIYLGGGFVLSLLAGVGLAFLREFTDQAIRTPIDVARFGHMSVLGSVPLLDDEEADIDEIEQATRVAPHSLVAEAFRQIRAHLMFSGPLESQRALLITSPSPKDGKTATAINLAVTFAQGNQRVLLVDCNFRRPAIRPAFAKTRSEGLSNILAGHNSFEQAVSRTELPNLDLLTSGPMPPNPAELLGSLQMRELIAVAKKKYDRVIFDGPPCLLISDALVLATQVDAIVMVARAASSSKGALRRARGQFSRVNARVVGAVLNGVQARPGGYFRQQYRDFYDYTNEEIVPPELPGGPPEIDVGPAAEAENEDKT